MKIALNITIDDTNKIYESIANIGSESEGVDPLTAQWMLYGMMTDAILKLRVQPLEAPLAQPPAPEPAKKKPRKSQATTPDAGDVSVVSPLGGVRS